MTDNKETPVFLVIDEYEALKNADSSSAHEKEETSRLVHEIMLLGRASSVDPILGNTLVEENTRN